METLNPWVVGKMKKIALVVDAITAMDDEGISDYVINALLTREMARESGHIVALPELADQSIHAVDAAKIDAILNRGK